MAPDRIEAERFGPLGDAPMVILELAAADAAERAAALAVRGQAITIGVDRCGALPPVDPAQFDCLLTTAPAPPAPWVHAPDVDQWLTAVTARVTAAPIAAATGARALRINEHLPAAEALAIESLAYSTLLGGAKFRCWRAARPVRLGAPISDGPPVRVARDGDQVTLTLARPGTRNAMTAAMRDALWEALAALLDDPSEPTVEVRGDGACFSVGGDLDEFGSAIDLAAAHAVRTARSCAALLIELGGRATAVLHGACIGSGIEIAAAAATRRAMEGAFFQLPELTFGLMPGAGGTVTVARAVGRHRTAAMLLSGRRVPASTALAWGLVDEVVA